MITADKKMVDLIHMNYVLIKVLNRFDISLGFGDKTIGEVCKEQKIDVRFFLEIINSFLDSDYFPKEHLQTFPVRLIIDYLSRTHQDYLGKSIPLIEDLINKIAKNCYENREHGYLLTKFFNEYKDELFRHIEREDKHVFPYARCTEEVFRGRADKECIRRVQDYSISTYLNEHDDIEEKLFDLKNIIIKYLPSPSQPELCYAILSELFNLEKDMNNHSRIEEKVLVPKVEAMEDEIRKKGLISDAEEHD
ncbi:MAG: hypothetical protein GXO83_00075 [Chlorobi bacterium]|nr:hypothetical protein [Chlorobiota bacterium]